MLHAFASEGHRQTESLQRIGASYVHLARFESVDFKRASPLGLRDHIGLPDSQANRLLGTIGRLESEGAERDFLSEVGAP
ncbi:MAG: hypothetical protein DMF06_16990 [Verrucomicrobia bacterium]|nr:MAG: hypothetical protein DMF06_16990 [Verrucomicrobiota bacterium]